MSVSKHLPKLLFPSPLSFQSKKPWYLSKPKLLLAFILVFLVSFGLAIHLLSAGYAPLVCAYRRALQEAPRYEEEGFLRREESDGGWVLGAERVRFPRTKRRLPQCIIIGVRKCGTRALLEFLNLHPSLQKASDEVHFFDDDSKYALGLEWYRRKMPYSFPGQITVEKSPAYFITDTAPTRIRAMNGSIRLLLIVRDPVTRLVSDYAQLAANKARKERSIAGFPDLVLHPDGRVNTGYKAVRISMYAAFLRRWLAVFPREQLHVVDGDALILDPHDEVAKVERFLGLAPRVSRSQFIYNKTKGFFCVRNDTAEKCLNESKGRKHPEVPFPLIRKLRKFYAPFNRDFYRIVGKNFGWPEE